MAERLRKSVATLEFKSDGNTIHIAVSIGVASWRAKLESQEELLTEVDKALYAAKAAGRNCVAAFVEEQVRLIKVV
jgi:diguanylate cyclase (GGDEF)-like protein